jgi:hypothetical protein
VSPSGERAPDEVEALAERRARARSSNDFAAADSIRDRIAELGWTVTDQPGGGWILAPLSEPDERVRLRARDVVSLLDAPVAYDATLVWVVEGWPEDFERAVSSFKANQADMKVQYVLADVTSQGLGRWGEGVESIPLEEGTGWGSALNSGLKRATGENVFILDGSIEATGPVIQILAETLSDPTVGVCGPYGIVTPDLQEFEEAPLGTDVDAIEGYLMATRRETLKSVGLFDEKFKWYRTADIEWSFRVKDHGLRAVSREAPVKKHGHRMWFETPPADRARWSKRNYYRFLEKFRDRFDLCVDPHPREDQRGPLKG